MCACVHIYVRVCVPVCNMYGWMNVTIEVVVCHTRAPITHNLDAYSATMQHDWTH